MKNKSKKWIPDRCEICGDHIGLYQPYYFIRSEIRHHMFMKSQEGEIIMCPACFNNYKQYIETEKNFIIYSKAKEI